MLITGLYSQMKLTVFDLFFHVIRPLPFFLNSKLFKHVNMTTYILIVLLSGRADKKSWKAYLRNADRMSSMYLTHEKILCTFTELMNE